MKRIKLLILPLFLALLLSGCGGRSLSDYTIVQGVGIDLDDDKTAVSLQYLNLAKSTGATDSLSENITTVTKGKSLDISDALFSASKELSQELFFGQNKIIIFGKDYVKDDISIGLDYLMRSVDSRPDVVVAVSDSKAENVIKSTQKDARIPIESIYNLLKTGEQNGMSSIVTVNDLLRLYVSKTSDVYMPVIVTKDNVSSCKGVAIFSNEKYTATLDDDQTLAFLLMQGKVKDASVLVSNDTLGNIGIEIVKDKCKKYVTAENNELTLHIEINTEIILDDIENGITASVDKKQIEEIEHLVARKIADDAYSTVRFCFMHKSDPLEIGKYLAKSQPRIYDKMKDSWRDSLNSVKVEIVSKSNLSKINDSATK